MENMNETADCIPNSLVRINQIVNEDVQKTWRIQARIKYLRIECGNLNKEIDDIKVEIETENETCKTLEENLERALRTKESEIHAIDVATKLHPQLVQRKIDENKKLKESTDMFTSTYDKHLKMFGDFKRTIEGTNPLLREVHTTTVEIKKLEFDKKFLAARIRDAEKAYELKKGTYQKMFHAIIIKFVQAVSQYHHRVNIIKEIKEDLLLMENQHKQYSCKYQGNKRASDNISNRTKISKLNLQLSVNLMGGTYQSILPEISLISSRHNYEMTGRDISSILKKKIIEEQSEMMKRLDLLKKKRQSRHSMFGKSNETKLKEARGSKRSFEDVDSMKTHNKLFKPKISDTELEICIQTKPQGVMKKTVDEQITSSQKNIDEQVVFDIENDTTTVDLSNKLQEKLTQLQSEKMKHASNAEKQENPADSTNFNFMLSGQGSQVQKNTKQTIKDLNLNKERKFPALVFGPEFQTINKKTQQNVTRKNVENSIFLKTPISSSSMRDENCEFSPYFRKSESLLGKDNNINEDQEKDKKPGDATTDLQECEYIYNTEEPALYVRDEFLTQEEDKLSATQNITFLAEDKSIDANATVEHNELFFNLRRGNTQSSSFRPFSFFN